MPNHILYLASGNEHKALEFQSLVNAEAARGATSLGIEIRSAREIGGMPSVVEDAGTFVGNALKKARALRACAPAGAWVFSDDSGLEVDALGGAPGVESAYYAGPQGDPAANLAKLVAVMRGVPPGSRGACFRCVLAFIGPAGGEAVFDGECRGSLLDEPAGGGGFGYDPVFVPEGRDRTMAEMSAEEKNAISHRALAWKAFAAAAAGIFGRA